MTEQASIEGQVLVKATAEIVAGVVRGMSAMPTDGFISDVFDSLEKKLEEYKKKHQGNQ